jgi:type III secretion protein V
MPGKQMAIDADLRAGFVDAAEARRRRRALERESQLHGAMDGALKFVKGDALAGVAIVLVNVVGGLAAGALRGMALGDAASRYTLLAIGDGLVSQLPALLISVSAAVAVTRVAGDDDAVGLGTEIGRQLTGDPRALAAVAVLLAGLAAAPGLPAPPFLVLAAGVAWGARRVARRGGEAADPAALEPAQTPDAVAGRVVLELGTELHALALARGGAELRDALAALAEGLRRDAGVALAPISLRLGLLPSDGWALAVDELPVASGLAPCGERLSLAPASELALVGIPFSADEGGCAISEPDAARAEALGPTLDPLQRALVGAALALRTSAHLLVGLQEAQELLDGLEPSAPALVREATQRIPPSLLAEVLRRLLEERVSIRPLRAILEAILEAGGASHGAAALAECCRRALQRHLGRSVAPTGLLEPLLVDPATEAILREGCDGERAAVPPEVVASLAAALSAASPACGAGGPVLLTAADVRRPLRNLLAPRFPGVTVLAYDELPPELSVRPAGRFGFDPGCLEGDGAAPSLAAAPCVA